ncbi:MAG: type VI secretion system membrane subunit TssM [Paracoccaceae bacterium]
MILRRFLRALRSFVFAMFFGTLVISVCLWFFGPLLALGGARPFDGMWARIVTIGILWFLTLIIVLLVLWRRRVRERRMSEEIVEAAEPDPAGNAISAEVGELRDKMRTALARLRKSKLGRRHLYQLPWYVVIGPPGAGKTTAIVNSGLQFPLADDIGKNAIGGVGGTRNCDWWFTNDAVLIDTAGRYTTQDSDSEADNAAWSGFLDLLKKYRKRQPINGAIIAISLSDLSLQDETTQMAHARAVRRRLHELRERLGIRYPVYILFTKADLVAGFSEFFDTLGKEDRQQVWGFTFDLDQSRGEISPMADFEAEFDALLARLNAQSLERMQAETDHQRRSLISGFPNQVASLRQVARDFLKEVFQDNRFEDRHMLRGVYLTSGTQEGTPIDRLMMGMARTFGIGRQAIGSGRGTGRSFFLTRLLQDVIFREAGLVSADDKVERRYRWITRGAIAASILVALGLGALWTRSYIGNRQLIADARQQVKLFQAASASIPANPVGDTDLPAIVPALNILRDMPGNPVINEPDPPGELTYGLYQGDAIGTEAAQSYRSALNLYFLPRLLLRLEEQIQGNMNNPELLYEALKVYLMLGLQGPMDEKLVREWMKADWTITYPGPAREQLRADLTDHLTALLSQPMKSIGLNGPLVEQVQIILSEMPMAQRVYNGIVNGAKARALPQWRLTDIGGPAISRVMTRSSGKALSDGIPGVFTYDGFNKFFLSEALEVSQRVQNESWVLGPFGTAEQSTQALAAISRDVLDLYYNDFIEKYDTLLGDIDIVPMQSLSHAVEVVNVLSGPTSPIVNILTAVANETRLTEDRSLVVGGAAVEGVSQLTRLELRSELSVQGQFLLDTLMQANPITGGGEPTKPPGQYVEERFAWLNQLVAREEGVPSQLDTLMTSLQQVYAELNRLAINSGGALGQTGEGGALALFQQQASRIDGPLPRWASQITTGSSGITAQGTRAQLNARWQSQVLPFCDRALTNRYPFSRRSKADVAIQDFSRLFAPGGLIDAFVSENLLPFIDTTTEPWTWKQVSGADLGMSGSVLQQIQNAAEIRDAFFAAGGTPSVGFEIVPEALDPKAKKVILEVDGQKLEYSHGQPKPVALKWPGTVGFARVAFKPDARGAESTLKRDGPWAWFRLLNAAEIRRTNVPDRSRVIFNVGGRIAIFEMRAGSVLNPFNLPALSRFSCPKSL